MEWMRSDYVMTDDRERVDADFVIDALRGSYWAAARDEARIRRTLETSTCFSVLEGERQVAFARVVGDGAAFAWIADVIVDPGHRGRGLGKWMMETLLDHPCCDVDVLLLATRDAQGLYARYGFREVANCMRLDRVRQDRPAG